jgi:hypothetical protein
VTPSRSSDTQYSAQISLLGGALLGGHSRRHDSVGWRDEWLGSGGEHDGHAAHDSSRDIVCAHQGIRGRTRDGQHGDSIAREHGAATEQRTVQHGLGQQRRLFDSSDSGFGRDLFRRDTPRCDFDTCRRGSGLWMCHGGYFAFDLHLNLSAGELPYWAICVNLHWPLAAAWGAAE